MMMVCFPPQDTSPHQDSAGTVTSGTQLPAQPPLPTTTDKGCTFPERANPTQTAYVHPKGGVGAGPWSLNWMHRAAAAWALDTPIELAA